MQNLTLYVFGGGLIYHPLLNSWIRIELQTSLISNMWIFFHAENHRFNNESFFTFKFKFAIKRFFHNFLLRYFVNFILFVVRNSCIWKEQLLFVHIFKSWVFPYILGCSSIRNKMLEFLAYYWFHFLHMNSCNNNI